AGHPTTRPSQCPLAAAPGHGRLEPEDTAWRPRLAAPGRAAGAALAGARPGAAQRRAGGGSVRRRRPLAGRAAERRPAPEPGRRALAGTDSSRPATARTAPADPPRRLATSRHRPPPAGTVAE